MAPWYLTIAIHVDGFRFMGPEDAALGCLVRTPLRALIGGSILVLCLGCSTC
jgi:hypothetical protein